MNQRNLSQADRVVFGRFSIAQLLEYQESLLEYVKKSSRIDREKFSKMYNRATLGLARDVDRIIRKMIFYNNFRKEILLAILPLIFNKVLARALKFKGEITHPGTQKVVMKI